MIVCVFWILFYHTTLSPRTHWIYSFIEELIERLQIETLQPNLCNVQNSNASESIKVGPLHFYHIACKQTLWEALTPRELACRQGITPKDERNESPGILPIVAYTVRLRPKGYMFPSKMVYKRVRDWTSGWSLPVQDFVEYPSWEGKCPKTFRPVLWLS